MPTRRTVLAAGAAALVTGPARAADYARALAAAYGGPVDPATGFKRAEAEARTLRDRADALLRGEGLSKGSVAERLRTFAKDPRWLYEDSDAGRLMAVAEMQARVAADRVTFQLFIRDPIPQPEIRLPAPADAGRGGYREPPAEDVDRRNKRARPAGTLPAVAYHETIPGHALQASVTGQRRPPSFSEAWAIYAEQLAYDVGVYAREPRGELGYVQWRLFRMGRVLADIGQGAMGWSLDQAVAAMRDLQGFDAAFVTMEADAARMRAQPAAYAAQGLGALAIGRERPRQPRKWRDFHHAILADAPWPYAMVRRARG